MGASQRIYALKGAAAVPAVQTGTASLILRYRAVLCCTGHSERYSLINPQVQDRTVMYRPSRQDQPHQSAGTGPYCAVPAVQTGTASPIHRYRTVWAVPAVQTGLVQAHQSAVQDSSVLYRPFRQDQPHKSAGTGLYCLVLVVLTGTASPIRRYRTVLCCTGRSDRYSLINPQVHDCTVLYRPFRQVKPHQSPGTGLYYAVLIVQTGTALPIPRYRTVWAVPAV